jgi:hypothetical protein
MLSFISSFFLNPAAHACATCGTGNDASSSYYLLLILIMTVIPVLLVGGTVLYIRKVGGQHDLDEQ